MTGNIPRPQNLEAFHILCSRPTLERLNSFVGWTYTFNSTNAIHLSNAISPDLKRKYVMLWAAHSDWANSGRVSWIQTPHLKIHNCLSTWNVSPGLIWEEVSLETWLFFFLLWRRGYNFSRVTYASSSTTSEISSLSLSWSCLHNKGLEASNTTHKTFSSSRVKWGLSPTQCSKCLSITAPYHDMFSCQAAEQSLSGRCSNRSQGCSHSLKCSRDSRSHIH